MSNNTFTTANLPALVEGSQGLALPKPGAAPVAAARPLTTIVMSPWGSPFVVDPAKGYWVIAQTPEDIYPNDEFGTFYEAVGLLPTDDPRTVALRALLGEVEVVEATKTKPAKVVGVLAEAGTFQTYEGPVPFQEGDFLLESPDIAGRMWPVGAATFAKKYDMQS